MRVLFHIANFKLRRLLKLSFDWKVSAILKTLASVLVFGAFAYGAYYSTRVTTEYLLDNAKLGLFLLHRFLSMLLFVYFLSINVGNIIVSYATFYRSSEVSYYLTKPISHTNLFIIKFFDNFFYSSTAFFLIAFAVVLGYGSHFEMDLLFYLQTMIFMLIPFMIIAGCIAVIMLLFIMRFAESIGVRKIIIALVVFYLLSLYGYFSLTNPLHLVAQVWQHYPNIDQYFGYLDPPITKYLPNYWIAESLYWTIRGETSMAIYYMILLVMVTIIIFFVMVFVGKNIFYPSWLSSSNLHTKKNRGAGTSVYSLEKPSFINSQTSVLLKKELWQFLREPSQWIHFGIISILAFTFIVSIANINMKQNIPFLQTVTYMVMLLFNAFLVASIALRFVFPSISVEGSNFWAILSAPVQSKKYYSLKFFLAFIPILLLCEILVIFSHQSLMDYSLLVQSAAFIMAGAAFALVGLNLGAGSYFSDYKENNPIRVASSQSATLTFLISIFYLTVVAAIIFFPFSDYFTFILREISFDKANLYIATLFVLIISAILGGISLSLGFRALKRDF